MKKYIFLLLTVSALLFSCESEKDRKAREYKEEQIRIELVAKQKAEDEAKVILIEKERIEKEQIRIELVAKQKAEDEAKTILIEKERIEEERLAEIERKETAIRLEKERKETAIRLIKERKEKAIYDKYINNSLRTGAKPYAYCFGSNNSCDDYGCSKISVKTPYNSDVLVTIKKNDKVYRHAYIKAGSTYVFNFPNGTYQIFFYYGKGWNPDKFMKKVACGKLKGGFISKTHFGKDKPQYLTNSILSYELILQQNGNFSTKPSNSDEAF